MIDVADLTARVRRARSRVDRQTGEARALYTRGQQLQGEIASLREQIGLHERATTLLANIGEQRQADTQKRIETLVTQGLRTIFGDDLFFHLVPVTRGKRPEVDLVIRSTLGNGTTVDTDVMDARGGGLSATVGFLLRVVVLLLSANRQDTVLFLDETFAHVSAEYEGRLAEFLRQLVDQTGIQVVMVTHSDAFTDLADVRYRFRLDNGITKVDQV